MQRAPARAAPHALHLSLMPRHALAIVVLHCLTGCGVAATTPAATDARPVQVAPPEPELTCAQWVARAVEKPDLEVDRVPEPLAYDPPPIPKRLPPGTVGKDGKAEVRIQVLVDTLGKADMRTFTVLKSSHPRLTTSVKTAVGKWTFRPAEVKGCKVPRTFNWAAVSGGQPAKKA
jgi:hypothetical protein